MTRINTVTKARKDQGICRGCGKEIKVGDSYQWIEFRFGGRTVKCSACRFRGSELTQSKMSGVYAAQEAMDDSLATFEKATDSVDLDDIKADMEGNIDSIREVAQEYKDAADGMSQVSSNSIADELTEKGDSLDSWADDLEVVMSDLEEFEGEKDDDDKPKDPKAAEEWRANIVTQIQDAFGDCPVD